MSRRPLPRARAATRSAVLGIVPPLLLVAFAVAVFFTELTGGPIFYGRDTTTFYYPLTQWAAGELKAGRLPLWTPMIFGGYPILADGELGLLSPIQVGLLLYLDLPLAYSVMRAVHYVIAALGLYLYTRALGANSFGGMIGGLAFAYSSFMVGHLQHDNILRSAAWLPWLLLAAERALRVTGPRRLVWLALAAVALALEGVGTHVQPVLMSLLMLGLALLMGPFGRSSVTGASSGTSRAARMGRLVYEVKVWLARRGFTNRTVDWALSRAVLGLTIGALGIGLAAAQLVPLYELGQRSLRPSLVTYDYATSFAVSPQQILTLFWPAMFNYDAERHWAFWGPHETTLYVGVPPLILAIVALASLRLRVVAFYGLVAIVSLALVFGDYLPIKPYTIVWNLPGFSYLRAPARFSLVLSLALSVLAAFGATWLARRARHPGHSQALIKVLHALLLLPIVLGLLIGGLRWWLRFDPVAATDLFRVALHVNKENWQLGPWHLYYGVLQFTSPDNLRTAIGLALMVLTPLLLRLWLARPRLEAVWAGLLVLLTAGDLWVFATSFYPQAPAASLAPSGPVVDFLKGQPQPFHLFVEPTLNPRYGANQMAGLGIEMVNGYSSLEPPRFSDYWWSVVMQDNFLLDMLDVRYVLSAKQVPGTRQFDGTFFHPSDRLVSGTAGNPSALERFNVQPTRVTMLTLVSAAEGMGDTSIGTAVAEVTLIGADGGRETVQIKYGVDVADYDAPEPGWPTAEYVGPRVVWAGREFVPAAPWTGDPVRLYGSTIQLGQPFDAVAVEVRVVAPNGRFHLHGLGLRAPDNVVLSVRPADNAKYRMVLQDPTAQLLENTAAQPLVSVVGGVVPFNAPVTAARLIAAPFDPREQALVEALPPDEVISQSRPELAGTATLVDYSAMQISIQVEMQRPGYVILAERYDDGWKATVDGTGAAMVRANGVERLVPVPAGSHRVVFTYQPLAFNLGLIISGLAGLGVLGLLLGAVWLTVQPRLFRRAE